ncbi:MAG TPA: NAD(P)/FAD-dependent oxidoreductase [Oligoflexia bacterium]|nr:NAD(P)/FAD-dependent oxidoreductase [Oligoflexia bacterium]HMP49864.1 NAD(P)/FAD-dependent oxidoreductase [Oligoflexia bacterium]
MSDRKITSVSIVGGGPSGSCLAILLLRAGVRVRIYTIPKRPELIVGESLIPAVITILRRLGVEGEVASMGRIKPGASLFLKESPVWAKRGIGVGGFRWNLDFGIAEPNLPGYAYNIPRGEFDEFILNKAKNNGAEIIYSRASFMQGSNGEIFIQGESSPSEIVVDATGRSRALCRMLGLPSRKGDRDDRAIFSHYDYAETPDGGNIHLDILDNGWSWRIPLRDRVSIGIVAPRDYFEKWDCSVEEQFDRAIIGEIPLVKALSGKGKRIAGVGKYSNYQWRSDIMYGSNWALVGDAAGFVDPAFSSGVFLSLRSAELLADTIIERGVTGFSDYDATVKDLISNWQLVVDSFYDNSFFNMIRLGKLLKNEKSFDSSRVEKTLFKIVSGFATSEDYKMFKLFLAFSNRSEFEKDLESVNSGY